MSSHFHLFILLLVCYILHSINLTHGIPSLRDLSKTCAKANESLIHCGVYPPGCLTDTTKKYSCEMIVTIEKFGPPCLLGNLNDPYIQVLCSKREKTFLITLLRTLNPDIKGRSCGSPQSGTNCKAREFIGVSFTNVNTGVDVTDEDLFYVCVADEIHIHTWNKEQIGGKVSKNPRRNISTIYPFETNIFAHSGVGIYWENVDIFTIDSNDFKCQFVISVDRIDLSYIHRHLEADPLDPTIQTLKQEEKVIPIALDEPAYLKLMQGWVSRKKDGFELDNVNLQPDPKDVAEQDYKFIALNSDKPIGWEKLKLKMLDREGEQTREIVNYDGILHGLYFDPVYEICQKNTGMCFALDENSDDKCFREDKESCTVLLALQFSKDYKELHLSLIVANFPWGGFSFSDDRGMGEDVGFICQTTKYDSVILRPQLNYRHAYKLGDDPKLLNLPHLKVAQKKETENEKVCTWTMATNYNVSTSPSNPNVFWTVDLINKQYYVLLAAGNTHNNATAYHGATRKIASRLFSKNAFNNYLTNDGNIKTSLSTFLSLQTFILFLLKSTGL